MMEDLGSVLRPFVLGSWQTYMYGLSGGRRSTKADSSETNRVVREINLSLTPKTRRKNKATGQYSIL
jgi:hypothetical protein